MMSLFIWMAALTVAVSAIVLSAAYGTPLVYVAMTGLVAAGIAGVAVRDHRVLAASGASEAALAGSTARHFGFVWAWGALVILITYRIALIWPDWWTYALAFAGCAVLCLIFAAALDRDARTGASDQSLLGIGRAATIVQLVGMTVAVGGLLIDGKLMRFTNPRFTDWAAHMVFFFGAVALALISIDALLAARARQAALQA